MPLAASPTHLEGETRDRATDYEPQCVTDPAGRRLDGEQRRQGAGRRPPSRGFHRPRRRLELVEPSRSLPGLPLDRARLPLPRVLHRLPVLRVALPLGLERPRRLAREPLRRAAELHPPLRLPDLLADGAQFLPLP